MGHPVILAHKAAAWFEGRAHNITPGGTLEPTIQTLGISANRIPLIGVAQNLHHQGLLKCFGGGRPTTLCHSAISASREAAANPSKSNLMLYSVPITRTEQSPTLFGHTYTQACGRQKVQWKEQGIENPRVGGSIPSPGTTFQKQYQ